MKTCLFFLFVTSFNLFADSFSYVRVFNTDIALKRPYYINFLSNGVIRADSVVYKDASSFLLFKIDPEARDKMCPKEGQELVSGVIIEERFDSYNKLTAIHICNDKEGIVTTKGDPFLNDLISALKLKTTNSKANESSH